MKVSALLTHSLSLFILWMLVASTGLAVVWSTHETRALVNQLLKLKSDENAMLVAHGQFLLQESSLSSPLGIETLAKEQLGLRFPVYSEIEVLAQ